MLLSSKNKCPFDQVRPIAIDLAKDMSSRVGYVISTCMRFAFGINI